MCGELWHRLLKAFLNAHSPQDPIQWGNSECRPLLHNTTASEETHMGNTALQKIILHDNAHPQTADIITTPRAVSLGMSCPGLASSDFHLIRPLKKNFKGEHFWYDTEVNAVGCQWLQTENLTSSPQKSNRWHTARTGFSITVLINAKTERLSIIFFLSTATLK
jgi:hypothetical protein